MNKRRGEWYGDVIVSALNGGVTCCFEEKCVTLEGTTSASANVLSNMSNSLEGGGVYMCLGGGEGAVALESNREVACYWSCATKLLIDTCTIARQKNAESLRIKDQRSRC